MGSCWGELKMPIIKRFLELTRKMDEVHKKKNDDYAASTNPYSNFDVSTFMLSQFNNPRDQSFVWPIATKMARLSTLLNSHSIPNNESITDSLIDIANYALLWACDIENRNKD